MTLTLTNVFQQGVAVANADSKHLLDVDSLTPEQIHHLQERASEFRQLRASRPFKSDSSRGG